MSNGKLMSKKKAAVSEDTSTKEVAGKPEDPSVDDSDTPHVYAKQSVLGQVRRTMSQDVASGAGPQQESEPSITTVEVDGEVFAVLEGDYLLDPDQLDVYNTGQQARRAERALLRASALTDAAVSPGGHGVASLIAIGKSGQIVRWAPGVVLTFCVLRDTFPTEQQYRMVVDSTVRAAQDWMDVCGIEFQYLPDRDASSSVRPEGVTFPVRYIDAGGAFIASAFFPTDMKSRWRVLIDPSYFRTSFDKEGVLRHELGHVLGFRHEHIRSGAPPVCPDESTAQTVDVTDYDPHSVMHYFCGGVGSRSLEMSQVDITGSQLVYGPPLGDFILLEP